MQWQVNDTHKTLLLASIYIWLYMRAKVPTPAIYSSAPRIRIGSLSTQRKCSCVGVCACISVYFYLILSGILAHLKLASISTDTIIIVWSPVPATVIWSARKTRLPIYIFILIRFVSSYEFHLDAIIYVFTYYYTCFRLSFLLYSIWFEMENMSLSHKQRLVSVPYQWHTEIWKKIICLLYEIDQT